MIRLFALPQLLLTSIEQGTEQALAIILFLILLVLFAIALWMIVRAFIGLVDAGRNAMVEKEINKIINKEKEE